MSIHIAAEREQIASTVFIPGDPKRGENMAKEFLGHANLVNSVRGHLTYTGSYNGKLISIHGTGMGLSNQNIFATELMRDYHVKRLIRVGTMGAIQDDMKIGDIIIAQGACTDSGMNSERFNGLHYAPTADFDLLFQAATNAHTMNIPIKAGLVFSTERFYKEENSDWWKKWVPYGVLGLEMESSELYTLAKYWDAQAISILTVSDLVYRVGQNDPGAFMNPEQREKGTELEPMFRLALSLAL